jgi:hypothetical protein
MPRRWCDANAGIANHELQGGQPRRARPAVGIPCHIYQDLAKPQGIAAKQQRHVIIHAPGGLFNARCVMRKMAFSGVFSSWPMWARNSAFALLASWAGFLGSQCELLLRVPHVLPVDGVGVDQRE